MGKLPCKSLTRWTAILPVLVLCACGRGDHLGKEPSFSNPLATPEHSAMISSSLPNVIEASTAVEQEIGRAHV